MKHEITTELRNSIIQVIANAVIKATWVEVNELLKKLQTLPEIKPETNMPECVKPEPPKK